jgi:hypothetical protein
LSRTDFWISRLPAILSIFVLIVFIIAIVQIQNFPARAKAFPLVVAYPMLILAIVQLSLDLFKPKKHAGPAPSMSMGMATGSVDVTQNQQRAAQQPAEIGEADRLAQLAAELKELQELEDAEVVPHTRKDVVIALGWFFAFFVVIWLIGMRTGIPVFTAVYLFVVSKEKWWFSILGGIGAYAFIYFIFDQIGHLPFFPGELVKLLGLD